MYQHPGNRPVNLNLMTFRFPLNAILSILHRITGVLMVIALMMGLIFLNRLILFPESFQNTLALFDSVLAQLILFGFLSSLWFHWLAGVRHLLIEHDCFGWLSQPSRAILSAKGLLVLFAVGEVLLAWEWLR